MGAGLSPVVHSYLSVSLVAEQGAVGSWASPSVSGQPLAAGMTNTPTHPGFRVGAALRPGWRAGLPGTGLSAGPTLPSACRPQNYSPVPGSALLGRH